MYNEIRSTSHRGVNTERNANPIASRTGDSANQKPPCLREEFGAFSYSKGMPAQKRAYIYKVSATQIFTLYRMESPF